MTLGQYYWTISLPFLKNILAYFLGWMIIFDLFERSVSDRVPTSPCADVKD